MALSANTLPVATLMTSNTTCSVFCLTSWVVPLLVQATQKPGIAAHGLNGREALAEKQNSSNHLPASKPKLGICRSMFSRLLHDKSLAGSRRRIL